MEKEAPNAWRSSPLVLHSSRPDASPGARPFPVKAATPHTPLSLPKDEALTMAPSTAPMIACRHRRRAAERWFIGPKRTPISRCQGSGPILVRFGTIFMPSLPALLSGAFPYRPGGRCNYGLVCLPSPGICRWLPGGSLNAPCSSPYASRRRTSWSTGRSAAFPRGACTGVIVARWRTSPGDRGASCSTCVCGDFSAPMAAAPAACLPSGDDHSSPRGRGGRRGAGTGWRPSR
jgi:hypothetical protein